ncbi:uncharacterized protein LOC116766373 [Danaus plexippus]|uniref:uncharacterized protein LOC116766373 n=1 Tax=Danaus plexippus TaxID=13037 RepID=UPI0013C44C8D|nr:uncharacterized protein LOC116766373 [Danaus plexippus]
MFEDDEDEIYEAIYENGHWVWDTQDEALKFIRNVVSESDVYAPLSTTKLKTIEFKDDKDLWEQQKFRKRMQRKTTDFDVVTLQDVKDVVLFTAPTSILSPAVINMLHLPTTERFLRALILCCQYYLQVSEIMTNRTIELETKLRTENSAEIEAKYGDDMEDLRLLIAKDYYMMLLGEGDFAKYHHMGTQKLHSLSKKEAAFFETILKIAIQIVWIALGRKYYNQIELEVNRIFKSDIYNSAEHKLNTNYQVKMNDREQSVLFGHCLHLGKKVNSNSPLINEVYCHRGIDYRLFGLGAIKYPGLKRRLSFLEGILSEPEEKFTEYGFTLGILGLARSRFDIMLKEIKAPAGAGSVSSASIRHSLSRTSRVMSRKSTASAIPQKLYPNIYIPRKDEINDILADFCKESLPKLKRNEEQRLKWIHRISGRKALRKVIKKVP